MTLRKKILIAAFVTPLAIACTVIMLNKKADISVNPDTKIKHSLDSEIKLNQKDTIKINNDTI